MKNIEDLIYTFENTGDNGEFFIGDYSNVEIAIYIRKQIEEIVRLNNVIKDINKILKNDDLCHIEKLQEIHKLVGSDKE